MLPYQYSSFLLGKSPIFDGQSQIAFPLEVSMCVNLKNEQFYLVYEGSLASYSKSYPYAISNKNQFSPYEEILHLMCKVNPHKQKQCTLKVLF